MTGCWPNADQEQLLRACFTDTAAEPDRIDDCGQSFVALWHRRRGDRSRNAALALQGHKAWLAQWRQNTQRCGVAVLILRELERAGIESLLLKGMALSIRHYRDTGVRGMGDIDLLVREGEAGRAVDTLRRMGWQPEGALSTDEILTQMKVRHAWQFERGEDENCDLHWRPVVRCYSPRVTELFWKEAEAVEIQSAPARVPGSACQLFHVCAHGLQWSWSSTIRWVPDALAVIESSPELNWDRVVELAREANMAVRLENALRYLRTRFDAAVPSGIAGFSDAAPVWERREYLLLQKPCPLGTVDSMRWHLSHFRRLRPFSARWASRNWCAAFVEYLAVFLELKSIRNLPAALWRQLSLRRGR